MGIYGARGGPKTPKVSEIDNFADFGLHLGGRRPLYNCITIKSIPFGNQCSKTFHLTPVLLSWGHFKICGSGAPHIWTVITLAPIGIETSFDRHIKGFLKGF